jgi:FHA domain
MSTILGYLVGQIGEFSGLRVAIPNGGLIIGRDPNQADLVVDHPLVSRRHAQVAVHTDGKLYLIDFQSHNDTYVNGHKLSAPVPLQANDKIEFGAEGTRGGKPVCTTADFKQLLHILACAGYGWLRPEGVRRELGRMGAEWDGPPFSH